MLYSTVDEESDSSDLAPLIGAPTLTYIPSAGGDAMAATASIKSQGKLKTFNDTQSSIISAYFEGFKSGFDEFIRVAHVDMKELRAFLIVAALSVPSPAYQKLFNHCYPVVSEDNPEYKQNNYFRELLFNFNKLCTGVVNINESIYSEIFDKRIDKTQASDSPTKKIMVTAAFRSEVHCFVQECLFDDNYVKSAIAMLSQDYPQANEVLNGFGKSKVRKNLFGSGFQFG